MSDGCCAARGTSAKVCHGYAVPLQLPPLAFVPFERHSNKAKDVAFYPQECST